MVGCPKERRRLKVQGSALIVGSLLGAACNLALPRESDDARLIERVGTSDLWTWLHAGLLVSVLLVLVGLHALTRLVAREDSGLASLAAGALVIGGTLMLCALAVAGVALRKSADNFIQAAPEDYVATFFVALGFDRLAYGLFAAAGVVLLGVAPVLLSVALYRSGGHRALAFGGVVAGVLGAIAGFVQLTAEANTFVIYLAASLAVTVWSLAVGVMLWRLGAASVQSRPLD